MHYEINNKEFLCVNDLEPKKRYEYFIKKICDWEQLWSLKDQEGYVLMKDEFGRETIPFWPAKIYAEVFCTEEWLNSEPVFITLEAFLTRWIPCMVNDKCLIVVFPTLNNKGIVLEPFELSKSLNLELENY